MSLDAMLEKLRAHTSWEWQKRDNDLHGNYLRADVVESAEVKLHYRVIPPQADVRYTGPESTTPAEWEAIGQRLIEMLKNALGATNVTPIDAID